MLTLSASVRTYLAVEPVDLRRGHDGLSAVVQGQWEVRAPEATRVDDQHVIVSDAIFEMIYKGVATAPRTRPRRVH